MPWAAAKDGQPPQIPGITTSRADTRATAADGEQLVETSGPIRFRFIPFPGPDPGRHTGAEYL